MSSKIYEELDEARAEIEKLKAELRGKTDSIKKLKKSHDVQVNQIHEAISRVKRLEQELFQKSDEIIYRKNIYEDQSLNLNSDESNIMNLSVVNDKLGDDCDENLEKMEDEKRRLVLVLEEENQQEKQEVECLSVSNKWLKIRKNLKTSKELGERNEEDNMKVEEQLKWKKEQFEHLQEVHENQFKSGMKDWELEKSALVEEISSLQSKLDSHIRMSQDLQHQLDMCKQSLAREESQRENLEVEVTDLKVQFNNVNSEYKNAKYSAEKLEQENHELRKSIRELQEAQIQEAKASYSLSVLRSNLRGLEQTYRECVSIFKARQAEWSFQKAQLTGIIDSCQSELKTKAATIEELKMELECSHSLTTELMLQNEEMSVMLLVLKQGISVAPMKLSNDNEPDKHMEMLEESTKSQMELDFKEKLKEVYEALDKANTELDERTCERNEMEFELQMWKLIVERLKNDLEENLVMRRALEYSLIAQIDFSESIKHDKDELVCELEEEENIVNNLQQELKVKKTKSSVSASGETVVFSEAAEGRYLQIIEEKDKILEELQKEVLRLKHDKDELVWELEEEENIVNNLQQELKVKETKCSVSVSGETIVSSETADERYIQIIEEKDKNLQELQKEVLMLKHDKDELVCELEEEENIVNNLQQELKVKEIKSSVSASGGTVVSSETSDGRYLQIIEELKKEVLSLELESFKREFESAVIERGIMERINELEKENHFQFIKRKNTTIDFLMNQATSLEKEFINSLTPFTSQLADKQAEIFQVQEACDKITEAEALAALEIEEKKLMIEELEDDIHDMEQKLKLQEEDLSLLKHLALDIEMEMDEKQLKIKELSDQMENKLRGSDVLLQKIKMENRNLLENATTLRLSPERENLLGFVMGLSDKMSDCTSADTRLIDVLRNLVQSFEKDCVGMNFRSDDGLVVKDNMIVHSPRSPFKEINN